MGIIERIIIFRKNYLSLFYKNLHALFTYVLSHAGGGDSHRAYCLTWVGKGPQHVFVASV